MDELNTEPKPEKKNEVTVRIVEEHSLTLAMGVLYAAEFIASFMLTTCILANNISDSTDGNAAAIASVFFFSSSALVYLLFCTGVIIYYLCRRDWGIAAYIIITTVGGICYLVGDNLSPIFQQYANELNCCELCTSRIKQSGYFFKSLATAIFFLLVPDTHKPDVTKNKRFSKHFSSILNWTPALFQFIRFDIIFSGAEYLVDPMNEKVTCPAGFLLYAAFIVVFLVIEIINFDIKDDDDCKIKCISVIALCINTAMLASYLLGDNMELLFTCIDNERSVSITRFTFLLAIPFLLAIYATLQAFRDHLRGSQCCNLY